MSAMPIVCLLTDFGLADHYVADMKGVLLSQLSNVQIVDVNHSIPAQDVHSAAYQLLVSHRHQPEGALFICVVDPGVGTRRNILYAEAGAWRFIAPDNGLLSWVLEALKPKMLLQLNEPQSFAAIGARILSGEDPKKIGKAASSIVKLPFPVVLKHGSMWQGEILAIDGFGSLVTNFRSSEVAPLAASSKLWIEFDKTTTTIRGLSQTYADVEPGKPLAFSGSDGFLEISVNQGHAASELNLTVGDRVSLHFRT